MLRRPVIVSVSSSGSDCSLACCSIRIVPVDDVRFYTEIENVQHDNRVMVSSLFFRP